MPDELCNATKDFQFEPKTTFKEAGQLEIKNKPEEFRNKLIGQLEIENKSGPAMQTEDELEIFYDSEDELTVVQSNIMRDYSRGTEMKDENSYEMEFKPVQEMSGLNKFDLPPRRSERVPKKNQTDDDIIMILKTINDDRILPYLAVKEIEGKGRGVVAVEKISK